MAGSLFVINIEGHYTYTVMPSQRLVSCDVIDIGNLIMCRTFGSMIVLFCFGFVGSLKAKVRSKP